MNTCKSTIYERVDNKDGNQKPHSNRYKTRTNRVSGKTRLYSTRLYQDYRIENLRIISYILFICNAVRLKTHTSVKQFIIKTKYRKVLFD